MSRTSELPGATPEAVTKDGSVDARGLKPLNFVDLIFLESLPEPIFDVTLFAGIELIEEFRVRL